jgi:hypothetical protein
MFRKITSLAGVVHLGNCASRRLPLGLIFVVFIVMALPVFGASDNCLSVHGIANKMTSPIVTANYSPVATATSTVFTYTFSGYDAATPSVSGIPGLISYCVYPAQGFLPDAGIAINTSVPALPRGDNGASFVAKEAAKGSFSFDRSTGDPSNIDFNGTTYTMGTASWATGCVQDPTTLAYSCNTPTTQTIVLHINDSGQCGALYPNGDPDSPASGTCWVFPGGGGACLPGNPVCTPPVCNGDPACKSADIPESNGNTDSSGYPVVPLNTLLHIHYTYMIVNQPTNTFNMVFYPPTQKTQDINSGGGKDYFGCEQMPDPSGQPGSFVTGSLSFVSGWTFTLFPSNGNNCSQSRFQLVDPGPAPITLTPGQSVTFTVDMQTRKNKGGQQEFTSPGLHLLNSGFTVKWFQVDPNKPTGTTVCAGSNPPVTASSTTLCSFSTGINPLYVDAQQ